MVPLVPEELGPLAGGVLVELASDSVGAGSHPVMMIAVKISSMAMIVFINMVWIVGHRLPRGACSILLKLALCHLKKAGLMGEFDEKSKNPATPLLIMHEPFEEVCNLHGFRAASSSNLKAINFKGMF